MYNQTREFTSRSTPELDTLKEQLSNFAEHKTKTGTVSYYAEGNEHNDLVMALMLACWLAREKYLTIKKDLVVVGGRYYKGEDLSQEDRIIDNILNRFGRSGIAITDVKVLMPGGP